MSQRVVLEPAFILHRRPYSNTSLILDLLTQNHGRISALAKSARGLKSRYKGALEMFSPLLVSWSGLRELKLLGTVELNGMPCLLEGESLWCGFYLNELLMRILHREDPCHRLFQHYQQALTQLRIPVSCETVLRIFEKELLNELGYGLPLQIPIEPDYYYQYVPDHGFLCLDQSSNDSTVFLGASLIALRDEQFQSDVSLNDAKRLMRMVIQRLLGGKSLKSRDWWHKEVFHDSARC